VPRSRSDTSGTAGTARPDGRPDPDGRPGTDAADRASFLRRVAVLFALGVPGLLALVPTVLAQLRSLPGSPDLPVALVVALTLLQSAVLLLVAVTVGVALAPRLGFRSYVLAGVTNGTPILAGLRPEFPLAAGLGGLTTLVVVGLDVAFAPFVAADLAAVAPGQLPGSATTAGGLVASLPLRLLYGGIVEELLLRFGLLTLLTWLGWRAVRLVRGSRAAIGPSTVVVWMAILVSAVLFGVGHLPALAVAVPLTPALVVRTVALNGVAGVAFGWLYWRRSLEAAMVAHAAFHVVLVALSLLVLGLVGG
jgi:membrane protease YdiL (CAAX protease family)